MTHLSCPKKSQAVYRPRRPEKTVLFQVIKKYYKTWAKKSENCDKKIPFYVHKEFKSYLKCGILAHGFAYAHCKGCNHEFVSDFLAKDEVFVHHVLQEIWRRQPHTFERI